MSADMSTLTHPQTQFAAPAIRSTAQPRQASHLLFLISAGCAVIAAAVAHQYAYDNLYLPVGWTLFVTGSFFQYGVAIALMVLLLRSGKTMWAFFVQSQLIVPMTVFIFQCWLEIPFSNWREKAISHDEACRAIIVVNGYLAWMNIISLWALSGWTLAPQVPLRNYDVSSWGVKILWAMVAVCFLIGLAKLGKSRTEFLEESGTGDRFLIRFMIVLCCFVFTVSMRARNASLRLLPPATLFLAGVMCILGFRYLLFILFLSATVIWLLTRPPNAKMLAGLIAAAPLAYFLLLISAYTRQCGMNPFEALSAIGSGKVPLDDIFIYAGSNEQCTFYSFISIQDRHFFSFGEYYGISALRLLPQGVYLSLSEHTQLSLSKYIMHEFAPPVFIANDLTLGGYFFTEAWVNFGKFGPFFMLVVSYAACEGMEYLRRRFAIAQALYAIVAASMFVFVTYGFENFMKPMMLFGVFTIAFSPFVRFDSRSKASGDSASSAAARTGELSVTP
jgi:hypothetical protein